MVTVCLDQSDSADHVGLFPWFVAVTTVCLAVMKPLPASALSHTHTHLPAFPPFCIYLKNLIQLQPLFKPSSRHPSRTHAYLRKLRDTYQQADLPILKQRPMTGLKKKIENMWLLDLCHHFSLY